MILYKKCKDLLGLFQKKGGHRFIGAIPEKGGHRLNVLSCHSPPKVMTLCHPNRNS